MDTIQKTIYCFSHHQLLIHAIKIRNWNATVPTLWVMLEAVNLEEAALLNHEAFFELHLIFSFEEGKILYEDDTGVQMSEHLYDLSADEEELREWILTLLHHPFFQKELDIISSGSGLWEKEKETLQWMNECCKNPILSVEPTPDYKSKLNKRRLPELFQ